MSGRRKVKNIVAKAYPSTLVDTAFSKKYDGERPKWTPKELKRLCKMHNNRVKLREHAIRSGDPDPPPPVYLQVEHKDDIDSRIGEVVKMWFNQDDNWLYMEAEVDKEKATHVGDLLNNQNTDKISLAYWLNSEEHKRVKEISLVSNPDFAGTEIVIAHTSDQTWVPLKQHLSYSPYPKSLLPMDATTATTPQQDPTTPLSDDTPAPSNVDMLSNFNNLSPEEQQAILGEYAKIKERKESKEQDKAQQDIDQQAMQFKEPILNLIGVIDGDENQKDRIADTYINRAMQDPQFAALLENVGTLTASLNEERQRQAAEIKLLNEQMEHMKKNEENLRRKSTKDLSGFSNNTTQLKAHSSSSSSMEKKPEISLWRRLTQQQAPASSSSSSSSTPSTSTETLKTHGGTPIPRSTKPSSSSSESPSPRPTYTHSASGFSLSNVGKHRDLSAIPDSDAVLITHSSKKEGVRFCSRKDSEATVRERLLSRVLNKEEDFGDDFNVEEIKRNSLLALNPQVFCDVIGEDIVTGNAPSNGQDGIFGYSQKGYESVYCGKRQPGNPLYRKDEEYTARYCKSGDSYDDAARSIADSFRKRARIA
jgi:hypothetical protein